MPGLLVLLLDLSNFVDETFLLTYLFGTALPRGWGRTQET
jgi:hypothetical protein